MWHWKFICNIRSICWMEIHLYKCLVVTFIFRTCDYIDEQHKSLQKTCWVVDFIIIIFSKEWVWVHLKRTSILQEDTIQKVDTTHHFCGGLLALCQRNHLKTSHLNNLISFTQLVFSYSLPLVYLAYYSMDAESTFSAVRIRYAKNRFHWYVALDIL